MASFGQSDFHFGKEKIPPVKLDKLKEVLDVAQNTGLKVVVTLFDFYGDYSVLNWTLTHRHASQIVSTFKNHKAILAWDIKNEPDLDFDNRGKETVMAWLVQMINEIKKFFKRHKKVILKPIHSYSGNDIHLLDKFNLVLITNLNLTNYRSYTNLELQLQSGVSIFIGKNVFFDRSLPGRNFSYKG